MSRESKWRSAQCARSRDEGCRLTVPEMRELLSELLEATSLDESLDGVVPHLRHAVHAIDDARAIALAVMQEVEAERSSEQARQPDARPARLC